MRHHCGCKITIQTDPKDAEYIVTDGARRKIEQYDADDAQTVELPDANEQAVEALDTLAGLEKKTIQVGVPRFGCNLVCRLLIVETERWTIVCQQHVGGSIYVILLIRTSDGGDVT